MKVEIINSNQVRFILSLSDLKEREISIEDLTFGSEKIKHLYSDMMCMAYEKFGFEAVNVPLMIEASPAPTGSISIIVTKIEKGTGIRQGSPGTGHHPQIPRIKENFAEDFYNFLRAQGYDPDSFCDQDSGYDQSDERESGDEGFCHGEWGSADSGYECRVYDENIAIYKFDSISDVIRAAKAAPVLSGIASSLYKSADTGRFYLCAATDRSGEPVSKKALLLARLCEYGDFYGYGIVAEGFCMEHYDLMIENNALETLSEI